MQESAGEWGGPGWERVRAASAAGAGGVPAGETNFDGQICVGVWEVLWGEVGGTGRRRYVQSVLVRTIYETFEMVDLSPPCKGCHRLTWILESYRRKSLPKEYTRGSQVDTGLWRPRR